MAWIQSHQELRDHPKVTRLARLLDVHRTSAVGLLHFLWWWALDHAEDGDLSDFDALDIALAAGWDGDPQLLFDALVNSGPGDRAGFIEVDGGSVVLHDWADYAGKLVARRTRDRDRKRAERTTTNGPAQGVRGTAPGNPGVEKSRVENRESDEKSSEATLKSDPETIDRLCALLADSITEHAKSGRPKISQTWRRDMDLLLRRGPTDFEPEAIEPNRIEKAIFVLFTKLATPETSSGFCWADVTQSPGALRKNWVKIRAAARAVEATSSKGPIY